MNFTLSPSLMQLHTPVKTYPFVIESPHNGGWVARVTEYRTVQINPEADKEALVYALTECLEHFTKAHVLPGDHPHGVIHHG